MLYVSLLFNERTFNAIPYIFFLCLFRHIKYMSVNNAIAFYVKVNFPRSADAVP